MNPEMNAFEYLKMEGVIKGLNEKELNKYIKDVINFIELEEFSYAPLRTYSNGMLARLFSSASIFFLQIYCLLMKVLGAGRIELFLKNLNSNLMNS